MTAIMLAAKGSATLGTGDNTVEEASADVGARKRLHDLFLVVNAYDEDDYVGMTSGIRESIEKAGYQDWVSRVLDPCQSALDDLCAAAGLTGVSNATSFASSSNYGANADTLAAYWTSLVAPDYGRGVYYELNGSYLEARNVYSPVVASMATRAFGAAFTDGTAIDSAKYAGAAILNCTVAALTGSGTVLVTGNGRDSNGVAVTGRTWSANITTGAVTALTPANAGDICYDVTNITLPAGITAGTATISAAIPAGRANPPL